MFNRRHLLPLLLASFVLPPNPTMARGGNIIIEADGVRFSLDQSDRMLEGRLVAPTTGWLAVGFNKSPALEGTQFLMAARDGSGLKYSERLALVPDHRSIDEMGLPALFCDIEVRLEPREAALSFRLDPGPIISTFENGGSPVGLMLAWSHATAFDHHSAWRRHYFINI